MGLRLQTSGGAMKPISDTAPRGEAGERPVRLLALGFLARETQLEVGAIMDIAASAVRMLQDNLARACDVDICADDDGRWPPSPADLGATALNDVLEPQTPVARVITISAVMTSIEHISHWGRSIPFELEIAKSLSAVLYRRQAFKSAFLALAGDAQDAFDRGGRLMMEVEGIDGSGRKLHQAVAWDLRPAGHGGRPNPDARQAFAKLLSLAEIARDDRLEVAVALDFALCRRRLIESDATMETAQSVVMRLQRIWLTQASMAACSHPQPKSMSSREDASAPDHAQHPEGLERREGSF
jgi:hypothetical protein